MCPNSVLFLVRKGPLGIRLRRGIEVGVKGVAGSDAIVAQ